MSRVSIYAGVGALFLRLRLRRTRRTHDIHASVRALHLRPSERGWPRPRASRRLYQREGFVLTPGLIRSRVPAQSVPRPAQRLRSCDPGMTEERFVRTGWYRCQRKGLVLATKSAAILVLRRQGGSSGGIHARAGASYLRHNGMTCQARSPATVAMPAQGLRTCDSFSCGLYPQG